MITVVNSYRYIAIPGNKLRRLVLSHINLHYFYRSSLILLLKQCQLYCGVQAVSGYRGVLDKRYLPNISQY